MTEKPAKRPLEGSVFDGAEFHLNLPMWAGYKPDGRKRDLSQAEGLLGLICEIVNAQRHSVGLPHMQRWGQELTELLQDAVDEKLDNPSDEFLADIETRFEKGVRWDRRLKRARGGVAFRYDAHVTSEDGGYALLAVMLMHPKYRQLIRSCPRCGKFFMRDGKQIFCTKKCSTAANDAGNDQRQKNRRKRRKALALLTGASPAKRAAAVKQAQKDHPDATPEKLAEHAKRLLKPNLLQQRRL